jgi:hypothetical protein
LNAILHNILYLHTEFAQLHVQSFKFLLSI